MGPYRCPLPAGWDPYSESSAELADRTRRYPMRKANIASLNSAGASRFTMWPAPGMTM